MTAIEETELRKQLFQVAFNTNGQDFYSHTYTELIELIQSREATLSQQHEREIAITIAQAKIEELHKQYGYQIDQYDPDHHYPKRLAYLESKLVELQQQSNNRPNCGGCDCHTYMPSGEHCSLC